MRYSIITPTICRGSLLRLCQSIDLQSQSDWEHLVVVDIPSDRLTVEQRSVMSSVPESAKRHFSFCDKRHRNYGHSCRHEVWRDAKGDYILYLDDDDYLADPDVLQTLDTVSYDWAVFRVLRHGYEVLSLPPGLGRTGTGMFLHRRETGRWPNIDTYEADGTFVEMLKEKYSYQVLDSRPLVVFPTSSCGIPNAESWIGDKFAKVLRRWIQFKYTARTRNAS